MERRKYIVWLLMVVNLIMLTAAVLPHHHHKEILCLQHDFDSCETASSQDQDERKDCKACCVTKSFCFVTQNNTNHISVCDLPAFTLFLVADMLKMLPPEKTIRTNPFIYIEFLHGAQLVSSVGLRAPPVELLA